MAKDGDHSSVDQERRAFLEKAGKAAGGAAVASVALGTALKPKKAEAGYRRPGDWSGRRRRHGRRDG